jgi:hypothetical protein
VLVRIFPLLRDYGMIVSKRRLGWSSKASKKGGDDNQALFGQMKKQRGKGPNKGKGKNEELDLTPKEEGLEQDQVLHLS